MGGNPPANLPIDVYVEEMYILRVDQGHGLVMFGECLSGCVDAVNVKGPVISSDRHAAVDQTHERKVCDHFALSQDVVQPLSSNLAPLSQEFCLQTAC